MKIMDPVNYPWEKDSPCGIYAAGRWFGSRDDPAWQARARGWADKNSPVFRGEYIGADSPPASLTRELYFSPLSSGKAARKSTGLWIF